MKYGLYIFLMSVLVSLAKEQDALQHIEADYAQGRLSPVEMTSWQLAALRGLTILPEIYRADAVTGSRRTTELMATARGLATIASGREKELLAAVLARPQLPLSIVSPQGHFRIHYASSGADAATADFINETTLAFENAWRVEVEELGFNPPPGDYNTDGPEYDIFVHQCSDYGATMPEFQVPETPQDDYTGWIELDNDFTHTPTKGLDGMRVTAAHEFFHLVQFGYRCYHTTVNNSVYFYESSASWMEDVVYDNINDYFHYLDLFFKSPQQSFITTNGNHEYGLAIFFHMLSQKYGHSYMKAIWNEMKENEPLNAMNTALLTLNSTFAAELGDFAVWNCFTGTRADTVHSYEEGRNYPTLKVNQDVIFNTQLTINGTLAPLASSYLRATVQSAGTDLLISPTLSDPYYTLYTCIVDPSSKKYDSQTSAGQIQQTVPAVSGLSEIWLVPVYTRSPYPATRDMSYQFDLTLGKPQKFTSKITHIYPNPWILKTADEITFEFQLEQIAQNDQVYADIFSENGVLVSSQLLGSCVGGWNNYAWNGRDDAGNLVNAGIYIFSLRTSQWRGMSKFAILR